MVWVAVHSKFGALKPLAFAARSMAWMLSGLFTVAVGSFFFTVAKACRMLMSAWASEEFNPVS